MQIINPQSIAAAGGMAVPLAILMLESDDDRQFVETIYSQYRPLLYKVARHFFPTDSQEMEDAVSNAVVNLCRYCKTIRSVSEEKLPAYLVCLARNVCNAQLKRLARQQKITLAMEDAEEMEDIADERAMHEVVLSKHNAMEMLDSFEHLSKRERELIRLRHIDMLDYEEIGQILGLSYGAARTAVSRAKQKLEEIARKQEESL